MKRRFFCFGSLVSLLPLGMKKEPVDAMEVGNKLSAEEMSRIALEEARRVQRSLEVQKSWNSVYDYLPTGTLMDLERQYSRPVVVTENIKDPCNIEVARMVSFRGWGASYSCCYWIPYCYWIRCSHKFEIHDGRLIIPRVTHWKDMSHIKERVKIRVSRVKP